MELILGDCLEKLKELEDNSVDSIVTDPPYGLSFMGKKWDYDVPQVEVWKECLRVLKPGGYLLSFAGTRTQHRMAVNIEDAGFEIRDMMAWVYGSGFPKSLNIGKAVDKLQGNEREEYEVDIAYLDSDCWGTPNSNKGSKTTIWQKDGDEVGKGGKVKRTKGTSEWEGWGTALKPALEPITVARKPLEKGLTIAENCLKWGVGGINIEQSRIGTGEDKIKGGCKESDKGWNKLVNSNKEEATKNIYSTGRFPANLIHDGSEEVVERFPQTKSGKLKSDCYEKDRENDSMFAGGGNYTHKGYEAESGSAARFFYCAKASKRERNIGCEGLEDSIGGGMAGTQDQTLLTGSGNIRNNITKNNHPTVKPVALMRYLCRLITPKGGVILDPYMGSGTTGIGAKLEGFDFIGIEREEEYIKIAQARIEAWEVDEQLEVI